ncbi:MAG: WhiB family transcriptional regulator [Ilumatobacteraceae bacterium]
MSLLDSSVALGTALHDVRVEAWREQANCSGRTFLFFAPKAERPQARARREAKAARLCNACEAREECRQFARENHEFGFWGGESRSSATWPATRSRHRSD